MLTPVVRNPRDSIEASRSVGAGLGGFLGLMLAVSAIGVCAVAVRFRIQFGLRTLFGLMVFIALAVWAWPRTVDIAILGIVGAVLWAFISVPQRRAKND